MVPDSTHRTCDQAERPPAPRRPGTPVATLLAAMLLGPHAAAEPSAGYSPGADRESTHLETITVTATRTERTLRQVPNVVTVRDRESLDRELVRSIDDLVRYEPGVSVTSSFGRFGLGGFRIRGLQGNRVRLELDGAPLPDAFAIGDFASAGRDFVDPELLQQVEIMRGPASALYGSDSLGGVVTMRTRDPRDELAPGESLRVGTTLGHDGHDRSNYGAARLAAAAGDWSLLMGAHYARGNEPRNRGTVDTPGDARTRPNPQDTRGRSGLVRVAWQPDDQQRWRLSIDGDHADVVTDIQSGRRLVSGFGPAVQVLDLRGDDTHSRLRLGVDHAHDAPRLAALDSMRWQVYQQQSSTWQRTFEQRAPAAAPASITNRERRFDFDQRTRGIDWTGFRNVELGGLQHALTFGAEIERSRFRQQRDGRARLPDGTETRTIPPDTFPLRDFPVSRTTAAAIYVQDEIAFADGAFVLMPGVRYDRFRLSPDADEIFESRNPGIELTSVSESRLSPRIGAVWQLDATWSLFASYAEGFRSPPYNDVNLGFTNLQFGYTALPNPDLSAETSRGGEVGLRASGGAGYLVLSAYLNRYRDFIESLRSLGVDPQTGLLVFQSRNVGQAEIRGAEAEAGLDLGALAEPLAGFTLRSALSWQRGTDRTDNQPLATIDPAQAVIGLRRDAGPFSIELVGTFTRAQSRRPPVAAQGGETAAFAPPGYAVFDLLAGVELGARTRLDIGVFNLTDRTYWQAASVPLVAADAGNLERFTRPGRSLSAAIRTRW